MSGDVQPRKRKDKRRKKDELGVEDVPRGTAAVFGEGDVLMHSHHDHGTGGHWCAKIIFFSLLAVLITLIGLIILENRGLSELEANAVESRYSGVLDGWIEDSHDDDHHDEHTLELKHHSHEDIHDDNDIELDHEDEDIDEEGHSDEIIDEEHEEDDEDTAENDESEEENEQDIGEDDDKSEEQETEEGDEEDGEDDDSEENDEDERDVEYEKFDENDDDNDEDDDEIVGSENIRDVERDNDDSEEFIKNEPNNDDDSDNDDLNDDEENESVEHDFDETKNYNTIDSNEKESKEDAEQDEEDDDDDTGEELEKIEREVNDEEEQAVSYEDNDDVERDDEDGEDDDDDGPESPSEEDISVPPVVEPIIVPKGKPFRELDDEPSSEKPTDTLAEEEEYERRQEELRQQKQESSSQMWLKLAVGGALLVATHAVIRRSTAPRDTPEVEENMTREETPSLIDRRMTLIPQETPPLVSKETQQPMHEEPIQKLVSEAKTIQSTPISKHESDEEEEEEEPPDLLETEVIPDKGSEYRDKELYSDEEEDVEDEEQEFVEEDKESKDKVEKEEESEGEVEKDEESEGEVADDVEIIDDEQIEEEIEEEDEEDISDVDDAELLSRLEAKYGRLPEPQRPEQKHKDGGNSVEDEWPGEPSEQYWRQQLDQAEREIRQGEWTAANQRLAAPELANSGRARWLAARSLDAQAEAKRDNALLTRAISAYLQVLKMYESLSDTKLREVATRALDRIQFRGNYLSAEPVYRLLIRRFPDEVSYRNNLTISFLMANRADLARDVLKETLKLWPEDRIALAHYAFVLKTNFNKLEESVALFRKALENDEGPACEPRFYYHLGDALLLLNRFNEAHEVHERGAKHGHFLSPAQRSLYNVDRLKSRPWWSIEETPYVKLARGLEKHWKDIFKEGEAAKALYEKEKEGLKEKGDWSQLDIFVRGQEIPGRCKRAPVTCSIVKAEIAAANCRRGQIKFSSMEPGTHVRPHVGPTNCRLRMHLGLSNTKDTYIRVDQEIRQWQTGKVLLFDDSFEHEVWHNGTGTRLVLIVDVWHPDLSAKERRTLPAI